MVRDLARNRSQHPIPRIVLNVMRHKPTGYPMVLATPTVLATPGDFGGIAAREPAAGSR